MAELVIRNGDIKVRIQQPSITQGLAIIAGPPGPPGINGTNGTNGTNGAPGAPGTNGLGVPPGGATGTILTKNSPADNDTKWAASPPSVPSGPAGGDLAGTYPNPTIKSGLLSTVAFSGSASDITTGTLSNSVLPPLAISETFPVTSQAAMLALTAQRGDVAVRSDLNKSFILKTDSPSVLADWIELLTPTDAVTSVAGKVGVVALVKGDVGLANVDNTSDASKPVSTAQATSIATKADRTKGGNEAVAAASGTTGTITLDCSAASIFTVTPTGAITPSLTNVPASGNGCTITLIVNQGATAQTVNLPTGGVWLGSAPTQAASKKCVVTMLTTDGGATWLSSGVVQA